MVKFKGTKGDWFITGHKNGRFLMNQGSIDVWYSLVNVTREEAKANALLISKAPEMLEMLESLENDNGAIPKFMWDKIQKLIKEATTI